MADSPRLETPRLRLISFAEEYLTLRYVGWLNDPEVVHYSEQRHKVHTLESCRNYWLSFSGTPHYFWAVVAVDETLGHIGNINAYVDPDNGLADVGILIGEKRCWRSGYGLEAWRAVCDYLLNEEGVRKVTAGTLADNAGMLKIMGQTGMVEDGRRQRHYLFEGREVDVVHGALFRQNLNHRSVG